MLAPRAAVEDDQAEDGFPGKEAVEAVAARPAQRLARPPQHDEAAEGEGEQVDLECGQSGTRQISMTLAKGLPSLIGMVSTRKPWPRSSSIHSASLRQ